MPADVVSTAVLVTKLIEDVPNVIAESVMNSVLTDADISRNMIADLNYGFNHNVQKYLNYGKESYTNGVPSLSIARGGEYVENSLDPLFVAHIPTATAISSYSYTAPNPRDVVMDYLTKSPEWNITASRYLVNRALTFGVFSSFSITATNIAQGKLYQFTDTAFLGTVYDYNHTGTNVSFTMRSVQDDEEIQEAFTVNYTKEDIVYNIRYIVGAPVDGKYFVYHYIYNPATGLIPELNNYSPANRDFTMYPVVPIRADNLNLVDDAQLTPTAASARELLNRININLDDVSEKIESNPDIADIDDVYLAFAADLNSTTQESLHYFYELFKRIYYSSTKISQQEWFDHQVGRSLDNLATDARYRNAMGMYDNGGLGLGVWFNFITVEEKTGIIGDPLPAYDSSIIVTSTTAANPIDMGNGGVGDINVTIVEGGEGSTYAESYYKYNSHVIIYRKQITSVANGDASNTYVELVVHGLQHLMGIANGAKVIYRSPVNMADGGFFIPVVHEVVKLLHGVSEIVLYQETLSIIIYAIEITKLEWYESEAFWQFIGAIIIVLTLVFGAPELGEAISAGLYATFVYVAEAYFYSIVIGEVFDLLIDAIGGDVALILAAIAFAFAVANGTDGTKYFDLISSEALMLFATRMTDAVNRDVVDDLLELQAEIESFETELEDAQDELDEAEKAFLNKTTKIELYALSSPLEYTDFTESPSAFYNRSIHMTNAVDLGRESISGYVDRLLTLPEPIRDTMRTV